jgi:addiction module HigA family antidote
MAIARAHPLAGPVSHPGQVLKDELEARGLSAHALAIALRLPASRISQILRSQRAITPETALRLARYFGGSAAIWLRLQVVYDLAPRSRARREDCR